MAMPSIVILVAGDPVPQTRASRGGFFELIRAAAPGFETASWSAHDLRELDVVPELTDASAVIVSGSPSSVTEGLPWMERAAERMRDLVACDDRSVIRDFERLQRSSCAFHLSARRDGPGHLKP